jgi:hypothetical protein
VAGGAGTFGYPEKTFDTSGKSGAHLHHPAICKSPMALRSSGPFGTIAGKKFFPPSNTYN